MSTLISEIPPSLAVLAVAAILVALIACKAFVAYRLGVAVISKARPKDLAEGLAAVKGMVQASFRVRS